MDNPELLLIVCEGMTEVLYFNIIQKRFRLPAWVKVIPELEEANVTLGQHEILIDKANEKRSALIKEIACTPDNIEVWAVCDRDDYKRSFMRLEQYANERNVLLAFSDPQFENYLLQHFSDNKSRNKGCDVECELTDCIRRCNPSFGLYKKSDLGWLDDMIDRKHALVRTAAINASNHCNHTKQPFFTIGKLVLRLLDIVE